MARISMGSHLLLSADSVLILAVWNHQAQAFVPFHISNYVSETWILLDILIPKSQFYK